MENKYYTPKIEEFHVGFEFETNYMQKEWVKKTLEFDDFGFYSSTWEVDSCPTEFRVKHLDREDIEEVLLPLNFILQENKYNISNHIDYLKGSIYEKAIGISLENSLVKIWIFDFKGENDSKNQQGPFILKIKNKSELKKLMQILNIE